MQFLVAAGQTRDSQYSLPAFQLVLFAIITLLRASDSTSTQTPLRAALTLIAESVVIEPWPLIELSIAVIETSLHYK